MQKTAMLGGEEGSITEKGTAKGNVSKCSKLVKIKYGRIE